MKIKLYNMKEDYIDYLNNVDPKIEFNKGQKRPYIGVILEVKEHKYFASLTSPKPKHMHMKNSRDFHKIEDGRKGAINFNNMIPADLKQCVLVPIEKIPDEKYRNLLNQQVRCLNYMSDVIHKKAENLYKFQTENRYEELHSEVDRKLFARCCDFKALEKAAEQYHEIKMAEKEVAATKETPKRFLPGRKRSNDEITR